MKDSVDDLGDAARVDMAQKFLNNSVLVSDNVRNDLLLLPVDEELHNFAEVASKHWVDFIIGFALEELE